MKADNRGVTYLVALVLGLAIVVLLLGLWQTYLVPSETRGTEIDHSQQVANQFLEAESAAIEVATQGSERSTAVRLGPQYPQYDYLVGTPRTAGTIQTGEQGTVRIDNASALGPEFRYWNNTERVVTDRARPLIYEPNYREYQENPTTVYDFAGVYDIFNRGDDQVELHRGDSRLIDNQTINLLALTGEYKAEGTGTTAVDFSPVSAPAKTVPITGTAGSPVEIEVPTVLSETAWEQALEDERVAQGGPIEEIEVIEETNQRTARIQLNPEEEYKLRTAKIGVGNDPGRTEQRYIIPRSSQELGPNATLVAEVRDRFNNPVGGAEVNVETTGGQPTEICEFDGGTLETGESGTVSVDCSPAPDEEIFLTIGDREYERAEYQRLLPGIEQLTVESTTLNRPGQVNLHQHNISFTATDPAALDGATIEFLDGTEIEFSEHVDLDGDRVEGTLRSPWIETNEVTPRLRVFDQAGNAFELQGDVEAPQTGTITGTVTDETTGMPIEGATVAATGPTGTTTAQTNAQGEYTLPGLPDGEYQLQATASGYQPSEQRLVTVIPGETITEDFTLVPAPSELRVTGDEVRGPQDSQVLFTITNDEQQPITIEGITVSGTSNNALRIDQPGRGQSAFRSITDGRDLTPAGSTIEFNQPYEIQPPLTIQAGGTNQVELRRFVQQVGNQVRNLNMANQEVYLVFHLDDGRDIAVTLETPG